MIKQQLRQCLPLLSVFIPWMMPTPTATQSLETYQGFLCEHCTSISDAKALVTPYGPGMECNADSCMPFPAINFYVVNPNSGDVFTLQAKRSFISPYRLDVFSKSFAADPRQLYNETYEFYTLWHDYINSQPASDASTISGLSSYADQGQSCSKGSFGILADTCPENTALATLLDANKMARLHTSARVDLMAGLSSYQAGRLSELTAKNAKGDEGVYSLTLKGLTSSLKSPDSPTETYPYYSVTFNEMEQPNIVSDNLVFKVGFRGLDANNVPLISLTLDEAASTVGGGYTVEALGGAHGTLTIENDCLLARLGQLSSIGSVTQTPIGGGESPGGGTGGGSGGSIGGDGGGSEFCTFTFRQDGYPDVDWVAPCNS